TQRDREQVEEAVVTCDSNRDLKKNYQSSSNEPWPARRPYEKRNDDFNCQAKRDREMLEPFRAFVRPPGKDSRQRLRPVMIIQRRERAPMKGVIKPTPGIVAAGK